MSTLLRWTALGLLSALCLGPLWQMGCVFDTSGSALSTEGTPGSDASLSYGKSDETMSDSAPVDLGAVDQLAPPDLVADLGYVPTADLRPDSLPDVRPPDALAADVPPPDTRLSCDEVFGDVPAYMDCGQTDDSCTFYFKGQQKLACAELCEARGRTCMAAANDQDDSCTRDKQSSCDHKHGDGLCRCTR